MKNNEHFIDINVLNTIIKHTCFQLQFFQFKTLPRLEEKYYCICFSFRKLYLNNKPRKHQKQKNILLKWRYSQIKYSCYSKKISLYEFSVFAVDYINLTKYLNNICFRYLLRYFFSVEIFYIVKLFFHSFLKEKYFKLTHKKKQHQAKEEEEKRLLF